MLDAPRQITVVVVDDHAVVRQGVMSFFETQDDIEVVGEASSGDDAAAVCAECAPDVVLMDLVMPKMDGVEATRAVKLVSPRSQVIVLTSYHDDEHILPAIRAGALSYLLKDVSADALAEAVRKAARGEVTMNPRVAAKMVAALQRADQVSKEALSIGDALADLTQREKDVLMLIAQGLSNAAIGERLFIADKTVKSHVSNILSKLHLNDRTQAAVYAWKRGVVDKTPRHPLR
jgi:NarL family two-component system response regulator LiaR